MTTAVSLYFLSIIESAARPESELAEFFSDVGRAHLLLDHVRLATLANEFPKLIFAGEIKIRWSALVKGRRSG